MYVREETTNTIIIEKSEFIAFLKRCDSEEEYRSYLQEIRKKYYDASHVCSAFLCGNIRRSSDDGEPSGTAGMPILNVLDKNHMDHTCALVVRYFGGIKLGAGGLIRAYGNAVSEALKKAVLVEDAVLPKYSLTLPYDAAHRIAHFLKENTLLIATDYDSEVTFSFALEDDSLIKKIKEYTKGVEPLRIGEEVVQKVL